MTTTGISFTKPLRTNRCCEGPERSWEVTLDDLGSGKQMPQPYPYEPATCGGNKREAWASQGTTTYLCHRPRDRDHSEGRQEYSTRRGNRKESSPRSLSKFRRFQNPWQVNEKHTCGEPPRSLILSGRQMRRPAASLFVRYWGGDLAFVDEVCRIRGLQPRGQSSI